MSTNDTLSDENPQYTDFTVEAGATLTVASGTVIRCTGTFTNRGTIIVSTGASGGYIFVTSNATLQRDVRLPGAGWSTAAAGSGEFGNNSEDRSGGLGGSPLSALQARTLLRPGPFGGGGGAAGCNACSGGNGGGAFTVLAKEGVVNEAGATIRADGQEGPVGGGGGAGGIVILASPSFVTNDGEVTAKGGAGGTHSTSVAGGGGGGGGIIHFLAPVIEIAGTSLVSGGFGAGFAVGAVNGAIRGGGGGGGALGGFGNGGGTALSNNDSGNGGNGSSGHYFESLLDPTGLF